MKPRLLIVALMIALAPSAWAALETLQEGIQLPPMPKPSPREVGYIWKALKDGKPYETKLTERTESGVVWKDSDGCQWTKIPDTWFSPSIAWENCGGSDGTVTVRPKGDAWPMQVGKKWSFDVDGGDWRYQRTCEVEDAVRVRIALGEYDTFKTVCDDKWNTRTYYYSPEIDKSVFFERFRRTKARKTKYELTE